MRVVSSCLISALLLAGLAAPAQAAPAVNVTLDVGLTGAGDPAAVAEHLAAYIVDSRPVHGLDAMSVDVPPDLVEAATARLRDEPAVAWVERAAVVTADNEHRSTTFDSVELPEAWTWTTGSLDVTVAVVDSGVTANADLSGSRLLPGWDFVDGDDLPADSDGHGTAVANVIAAEAGNDVGTVGVCRTCAVLPVRVLNGGKGTSGDVASGITWAADHGADVINLSLSTPTDSHVLREAVTYANARGAVVVASAGNNASADVVYPAAIDPVVSVAQNAFRNKTWADLAAPSGYLVLGRAGQLTAVTGASGATATVSGIAALGLSLRPGDIAPDLVAAADPQALQPPLVNAARLAYGLTKDDDVPPTVLKTDLTDGQPFPADGKWIVPTATDDHGVDYLDVIVGDSVVATAKWSGQMVRLRPPAGLNGPMPVTVRAYDYAGHHSEVTTVVQVDTTRPAATLVSPAANAVVHGSTIDLTVSSTATDVAQIYSLYDNGFLTRVAGTNTWKGRVSLDPSGRLTVAVDDKAGNRTELSRTVRIDNAAPAGGTIAPAQNVRVRGTFSSKLTGVTDLGGVAKAELWVNNKYVGADKTAPYSLTVKGSGKVALKWKVTDRFGQSRTLPIRTVTADAAGPSVSITKAPKNKAKVKGTVTVTVKASDPSGVARVELIVNGKVVARDYTSGYALKVNTKNRAKTLKVQVRAYDKLGNVRYTASRTWTRA
ncbi:S8 family serine peptidase [Symbioplanes lichenis]|uniref:S8 family serine peptidase n=1 Tax=Symbioplanes lichenis TaxID=1629072 RepID=UPI00273A5471|nr:S8 family serine peptidase [Actinoplanes lichenis]